MLERALLAGVLLGLVLVACSPKEASEGTPCGTTPAPIADPKFPTPFPAIDGVTWTATNQAGPSQIVQGFSAAALTDLFEELKVEFGGGGFSVEKDERDPHDAEVNFVGEDVRGQVRLGEECQGRTSVTITIRPKS